MLSTGTTTFSDMYIRPNAAAEAVINSGIRGVMSYAISGEKFSSSGINSAREEIERYGKSNSRLKFMLAPHAPYSCSSEILDHLSELSGEHGIPIHIHLSESENEVAFIKNKYGMSPTKYVEHLGLLKPTTTAAHCVYLDDDDLDSLSRNQVNVVTNPISNLKLANGIAPIPRMLSRGINVTLGTDGPASNNNLNMFKEMAFLSLIHKGINQDSELLSASKCLDIATRNAAIALGEKDRLGVIKEGAQADLIILDIDKPHYYPHHNLLSSLVYSSNAGDVETVIVDGKILFHKNEFLTIDREAVIYNVSKIMK